MEQKQLSMYSNRGLLSSAALVSVVTFLILRNLALHSPVMAGDEYAYYAAAKMFPDASLAYINDPFLQKIYSPLFSGLGYLLFTASSTPEVLMKVVNSIAFGLTALLFAGMLAKLHLARLQILGLCLFIVVPISSYTAYFMPEAIYALLFWSLAACMVLLFPAYPRISSIIAGGLVGTMLLIKPHALAIFLSVIATFVALALAPRPLRPSRRELLGVMVFFTLATYFAMVVLNWAVGQQLNLHPLAFVGSFYRSNLAEGTTVASWWGRKWQLLAVAAGHLVLLTVFVAPAVALSWGWIRDLGSRSTAADDRNTLHQLSLFILIALALAVTTLTVSMAVNFTVQVGQTEPTELQRLHGRYYSFVIPLYLLAYLWLFEGAHDQSQIGRRIRLGGFFGLLSAVGLVFLHAKRIIYPWDYPEAFVFSNWHDQAWLAWVAIGLAVITYILIAWRGPSVMAGYMMLLAFVFIGSNFTVTKWQIGHSRTYGLAAEKARALKSLIPPNDAAQGVIVGSDRYGQTAYYLFGMMAAPAKVIIRPAGFRLTENDLPKDAKWVFLTDLYGIGFHVEASLGTGRLWLGRITPGGLNIHENVKIWSGRPLYYSFANELWRGMLQGFNDPEPWGVWSAVEKARIILPEMISGAVEIRVDGWVLPANLSQPLELRIGDARARLRLSDKRGIASVALQVDGYHREISLAGLKPYQEHVWERRLGVALVGIEIRGVSSRVAQ
jgi:phosphoglycerol transferase